MTELKPIKIITIWGKWSPWKKRYRGNKQTHTYLFKFSEETYSLLYELSTKEWVTFNKIISDSIDWYAKSKEI